MVENLTIATRICLQIQLINPKLINERARNSTLTRVVSINYYQWIISLKKIEFYSDMMMKV